jgi:ribosome-associated protein
LEDNKAQEITILPIADKTVMTDVLIVATGSSRAQIHGLADKIIETFSTPTHPIRRDGYGATDWVVLDMGSIMVHLFRHEARALYNLEGMWS